MIKLLLKSRRVLQANAPEQQRKEPDAKTKQPVQIVDVTCTKIFKKLNDMKTTILFALDLKTDEILISESEKGSNKVNLIERIERNKNELLFDAIVTLTRIASSANIDLAIFKAMDKVCQMIYSKHVENK